MGDFPGFMFLGLKEDKKKNQLKILCVFIYSVGIINGDTHIFSDHKKQSMSAKNTPIGSSTTCVFGDFIPECPCPLEPVGFLESVMPEYESELPPTCATFKLQFSCLYEMRDISNSL